MTTRLAQGAVRASHTLRAFARSRTFAFASLATLLSCCSAPAAHAVNTSASSNGYGMFVDLNALSVVNLDVGPLPVGVNGVAPAPYANSDTVLNVNVSTSVPVVATATATAGSVTATAASNVNGGLGSRTTSASGGVVGAGVNAVTLPVLPPGITLLGINGTLSSTAQVAGDFGSLVATGTTTIQSLGLTISGIPVNLSAYVNVPIAPNTSVNLAALGIANASLILNEQVVAGDQSSISVNAFHLNVNVANSIVAQVILGHSQAQMTAVAIPEPATVGMATVGMVGAVAAARRRTRRGA
ncbi:PEP-CTERM sorting domain-containing protein [Lacipirellula parvula]|uniref:Ice-binding protein C-terminal domain-containing protein n=1 Tax=Lacipirellula parvula TaxID=2650471 RepID=A0A5K7X7M0_9BACT|nr:PEP-CTERM sorting domain-containing protein [Lacipirellula parvula]BBO30463.1 hypothetical protein PLANPX_0075 [Lacipirellula parvula]